MQNNLYNTFENAVWVRMKENWSLNNKCNFQNTSKGKSSVDFIAVN
jgi:hypothetical protein